MQKQIVTYKYTERVHYNYALSIFKIKLRVVGVLHKF